MPFQHSNVVEVRQVPGKGRGVFALRSIPEGEVIERVPVIVLPLGALQGVTGGNCLDDYCFEWTPKTFALALGYGSLYNHSYEPNARYDDLNRRTKIFTALRDIEVGEEITINYNGDPDNRAPVWFDVIDSAVLNAD